MTDVATDQKVPGAVRQRRGDGATSGATERPAGVAVALLCVMITFVAALSGCTGSSSTTTPNRSSSGTGSTSSSGRPASSGRTAKLLPRVSSCPTATPVYLESQGPVVAVTSDGTFHVAGNIQAGSVPPTRGDVKIVWRVTGAGRLSLRSTGPDGRPGTLVFGPELHGGSNFGAPGTEWGSGFHFDRAGCWTVLITRGHQSAQVTIAIAR